MISSEPENVPVTLQQILDCRELRAQRQQAALARYHRPIVSLTIVMPGPVKDTKVSRYLFGLALANLAALCDRNEWAILDRRKILQSTGPEAIVAIDAPADTLKRQFVRLEEDHPLGRLWDFDVISPGEGAYSRARLGLPCRKCLICDEPAHACSRSCRHSTEELLAAIEERVDAFRCS